MPALAIQTMHKARTAQPSRRGTPASQASSIQRYNNARATRSATTAYRTLLARAGRTLPRPTHPAVHSAPAFGCPATHRARALAQVEDDSVVRGHPRVGQCAAAVDRECLFQQERASGKAQVGKRKWESASGRAQVGTCGGRAAIRGRGSCRCGSLGMPRRAWRRRP
jgi:hypothetical protein